jgi:hypothetical protein
VFKQFRCGSIQVDAEAHLMEIYGVVDVAEESELSRNVSRGRNFDKNKLVQV